MRVLIFRFWLARLILVTFPLPWASPYNPWRYLTFVDLTTSDCSCITTSISTLQHPSDLSTEAEKPVETSIQNTHTSFHPI